MRYGERTARGRAEGEAMLKERRKTKRNTRIIRSRNRIREGALFRPPTTSALGEEDNKSRERPLREWSMEFAGLRARDETTGGLLIR